MLQAESLCRAPIPGPGVLRPEGRAMAEPWQMPAGSVVTSCILDFKTGLCVFRPSLSPPVRWSEGGVPGIRQHARALTQMHAHTHTQRHAHSLSVSLVCQPDEAEQEPVPGCGVPGGGCRMPPLCACVPGLCERKLCCFNCSDTWCSKSWI